MIDLKAMQMVLTQLEEERGIKKEQTIQAIADALATAYKKEYGKRGQIVRANFDPNTGTAEFIQVKIVVDETTVRFPDEEEESSEAGEPTTTPTDTVEPPKKETGTEADMKEEATEEDELPVFNPEQHILLADARLIKKDAELGDEMIFPLEMHDDFGRIAAQTAKQMIIQQLREAEKAHLTREFGEREGEIVTGSVQRIERGNIFVDLGRATGLLPYEEQIPGERYRQGERVRAYLYRVEETPKGVFLRLSRSHPSFLLRLFEAESPEVAQGIVEIKAIAREAGSRSKVAVYSHDEHIDPVGALVGQRGVRVSTVMSELGGEKIDIIEWSENPEHFIEDALSPAKVLDVEIVTESDEEGYQARVLVSHDQQSLAIGRGGQNVRLAAKLTGWRIDIQSEDGPEEEMSEPAENANTADENTKDEPETETPATESDESVDTETAEEEPSESTSPEAESSDANTEETSADVYTKESDEETPEEKSDQ